MQFSSKLALTIVSLLIFIPVFFIVLEASIPVPVKFLMALAVLSACGYSISKALSLTSYFGLFLLKSRMGLGFLDRLASTYPKAWQNFAKIGMVIGYGSLAYFLMNERLSWKRTIFIYGLGVFLLVFLSSLVPVAMSVLLSMVKGGAEFSEAGARLQSQIANEYTRYFSLAMLVVGGIALLTTASVVMYAGVVLNAILRALSGNISHLQSTSPGGMPILPGINLDLMQGIFALAIVLLVHEAMHGILARVYKMPIKSAGLVFFGFIPFGAFVDINEKTLLSNKKEKQNAVLIAGTAGNFATSLLFFFIFLGFVGFATFYFGSLPEWARNVGRFLALTFSLNAIVASVNLLPLPMFDGHHLLRNLIGNNYIANAISYLVGFSFLLTLSPWLLR